MYLIIIGLDMIKTTYILTYKSISINALCNKKHCMFFARNSFIDNKNKCIKNTQIYQSEVTDTHLQVISHRSKSVK